MQILIADPDVQAKARQIILWIPHNIEKFVRASNIAYGGLNILGGSMRVFSGIEELRANFAELTVQEKIVFYSVIFVNIVTIVGGALCCFENKLLHPYNVLTLLLNNARRLTSKYYPMLFCRGEARIKLTKIFMLAGGGPDGHKISNVSVDDKTVLSTNIFGKAISLIPVVGRPLLKLICQTCFAVSFLTYGFEVSKKDGLIIRVEPAFCE